MWIRGTLIARHHSFKPQLAVAEHRPLQWHVDSFSPRHRMLPHERLGPPRIWGIGVVAMGWRVGTEHCCWNDECSLLLHHAIHLISVCVRMLQPLRISPRRWEYIERLFGLVSAADRSRSSRPGHYFVTQFKHQMNPLSHGLSGGLCNFVDVITAESSRSTQAFEWVSILLALLSPSSKDCLEGCTLATSPEITCSKDAFLLARAMS